MGILFIRTFAGPKSVLIMKAQHPVQRLAFYTAIGLNIVLLSYFAWAYTGLEFWQTASRWTARVSLLTFMLLLIGRTRKWVDHKGQNALFLAFAVAHLIHLVVLSRYQLLSDGFEWSARLVAGAFTYSLILFTPVIGYIDLLPKALLKLVRNVTLLAAWLTFLVTYILRLAQLGEPAGGATWEYWTGLVLVTVTGLWVATVKLNKKKKKHRAGKAVEAAL